MAELEIYTYLRRKILWREQLRQRVEFLKQNPGAITLDDYGCSERPRRQNKAGAIRGRSGTTGSNTRNISTRRNRCSAACMSLCGERTGIVSWVARFLDNWHLKALCQEWQDLLEGKIERLMVNQPPHSTKALSQRDGTCLRIRKGCWVVLYSDFVQRCFAAKRRADSVAVNADWYRRRFPHVQINSFKENYFTTTAGGFRRGSSVGTSITGWHPRLICIDDPSQAAHVTNSPVMLQKVISWYAATVPSRGMASDKDRRTKHLRS